MNNDFLIYLIDCSIGILVYNDSRSYDKSSLSSCQGGFGNFYITSIESGFDIWGMHLHMHASAHAYKIRDVQKKAHLIWLKKLQDVWQIARLQRFLSFRFYKIQRSYEKIMCIYYFIGSVVQHWTNEITNMQWFRSSHKERKTLTN